MSAGAMQDLDLVLAEATERERKFFRLGFLAAGIDADKAESIYRNVTEPAFSLPSPIDVEPPL